MSHAQFQNARFTTGRLPVSPSRESFSASGRPAAASTTRNVSQNQHFFSARGASGAGNGRSAENGGGVARPGNSSSNARSSSGFQRLNQSSERSPETRASSNSVARPGNSGGSTAAHESRNTNGGGWQKFSPMPPRSSAEPSRGGESAGRSSMGQSSPSRSSMGQSSMGRSEERGSYGSSYGSGRGSAPESRGYSSPGRGYGGGYSRPPLNMRQPIVTPRSYGGGAYGGGRPAPSYGGGRPAPSYGGGRSAPSYGGGHSAPSSHGGGGGSSHGGGGGGRHGR